ncbi:LemA family protein [Candidatus Parcubacteria bacterium]|nr:MAG: LemA family protein [Candidatus Parcubacteria bacterium]
MWTYYILGGIAALVILWLIAAYNGLVRLRQQAHEAESDIDVQLKRRFDLVPNLVETVKGYAGHERQTLESVTEARTRFMSAKNTKEQLAADNMLSDTLKTLFAVSESYPDLKANANFLELQRELADTENKIQAARRFYNANVRDLNVRVEQFPTNLVAGSFGFQKMDYFEAENEAERQPVAVKF